jgi:hypothetical protein
VIVQATAAGYVGASAELDVTDDEPSLALALSGDLMWENGGTLTGTVSRIAPDLSEPVVVTITSSDPTAATVPPNVTIAGGQSSAQFTITAVNDALSDGVQTTTITVSAAGYDSAAQTLLVADDERPYQNPRQPLDVDGDQFVVARDAIFVINILNAFRAGLADVIMDQYEGGAVFPDTNGDNWITAIDALLIINKLNNPEGEGEHEAFSHPALPGREMTDSPPQALVDEVHVEWRGDDDQVSERVSVDVVPTVTDPPWLVGDPDRIPGTFADDFAGDCREIVDLFFAELGTGEDEVLPSWWAVAAQARRAARW